MVQRLVHRRCTTTIHDIMRTALRNGNASALFLFLPGRGTAQGTGPPWGACVGAFGVSRYILRRGGLRASCLMAAWEGKVADPLPCGFFFFCPKIPLCVVLGLQRAAQLRR